MHDYGKEKVLIKNVDFFKTRKLGSFCQVKTKEINSNPVE